MGDQRLCVCMCVYDGIEKCGVSERIEKKYGDGKERGGNFSNEILFVVLERRRIKNECKRKGKRHGSSSIRRQNPEHNLEARKSMIETKKEVGSTLFSCSD